MKVNYRRHDPNVSERFAGGDVVVLQRNGLAKVGGVDADPVLQLLLSGLLASSCSFGIRGGLGGPPEAQRAQPKADLGPLPARIPLVVLRVAGQQGDPRAPRLPQGDVGQGQRALPDEGVRAHQRLIVQLHAQPRPIGLVLGPWVGRRADWGVWGQREQVGLVPLRGEHVALRGRRERGRPQSEDAVGVCSGVGLLGDHINGLVQRHRHLLRGQVTVELLLGPRGGLPEVQRSYTNADAALVPQAEQPLHAAAPLQVPKLHHLASQAGGNSHNGPAHHVHLKHVLHRVVQAQHKLLVELRVQSSLADSGDTGTIIDCELDKGIAGTSELNSIKVLAPDHLHGEHVERVGVRRLHFGR
eukprot:RCo010817